jgi:hypothetical protein
MFRLRGFKYPACIENVQYYTTSTWYVLDALGQDPSNSSQTEPKHSSTAIFGHAAQGTMARHEAQKFSTTRTRHGKVKFGPGQA